MNRRQKVIIASLWVLLIASTLVLTAAWSSGRLSRSTLTMDIPDAPPLFEVPAFALTNQNNQPVTRDALKGHPWVAAFIFTRCGGPCPLVTANMANLQSQLPPDVKLISFSLDAEYDTPTVLKEYADKFKADSSSWYFLTGGQTVIDGLAEAMKIAAERGPNPTDIEHGTHLVLVNSKSQIVGYYRHDDAEARQKLLVDAKALMK